MNISVLTCLWIISSVYFPFSILNGFISSPSASQTYFLLISPASLRRWDSRPKLCRYDKWIVFPCRYSQVAQRWEHLQQTPCSGWSEMLSVPLDGWYRPEGQQQSIWSHRVSVLIKKNVTELQNRWSNLDHVSSAFRLSVLTGEGRVCRWKLLQQREGYRYFISWRAIFL